MRGDVVGMLYLIGVEESKNEDKRQYSIFETRSESLLIGNKKLVVDLLKKYKMEAKNFCIHKGQIEIKKWPHKIKRSSELFTSTESDYVLLTSVNEQKFKVVSFRGVIYYFGAEELKRYIRQDKIANCDFTSNKETIYKSVDTYSIHNESNFEKFVVLKYEEFRAKTLMLGLDVSFKYIIEGKDVNLVEYTGTSNRVILPSFITTINKGAFKDEDITEIKLNEGLKYIGQEAFMDNKLSHIEIPISVEFIGGKAFYNNERLLGKDGDIDKNKVKLLNSEALVM